MLREDKRFTDLEARALDAALILHADHGSNNSTFTSHVTTSTGTGTYSAMTASLCSLEGPRHGGANAKVVQMMADLLAGRAFDGQGLIYGLGHAVYTLSDPRAEMLRDFVEQLAAEKGFGGPWRPTRPWSRRARPCWRPGRAVRRLPTWIFTADCCTGCWACPRSCSPRCSPSPAWPGGALTAWRSWARGEGSSAPPPSAWKSAGPMCLWTKDRRLRRSCPAPPRAGQENLPDILKINA